jgi:hypothetical protein
MNPKPDPDLLVAAPHWPYTWRCLHHMANRGYAQIFTSIWSDDDFRKLSLSAQRLYFVLLSQSDISYAGVLPLTERRWARCCTGTSRADIETTLEELEERQYVVIDHDTEELLVRSFMRNDGLWKQPKMLGVALREAVATASPHLRQALARELGRLREALATASGGPSEASGEDRRAEMISDAEKALVGTPDEAMEEALPTASAGPRVRAGATPTPTPAPTPAPGTSELEAKQSGRGSLEVDARDASAPTPNRSATERPADRCSRHAGLDGDPGPCRLCGDARQAAADWDAAAARTAAAARRSCRWCDADGWRVDPEHPHRGPMGVRCDHTPLAQHLAEASR